MSGEKREELSRSALYAWDITSEEQDESARANKESPDGHFFVSGRAILDAQSLAGPFIVSKDGDLCSHSSIVAMVVRLSGSGSGEVERVVYGPALTSVVAAAVQ